VRWPQPTPAVVVAQISGVPTSPGFKMTVNKGETGAPEPSAIGARPIDYKDKASAAHGGEASAHGGEEPASGGRKTGAKGVGGKAHASESEARSSSAAAPMDVLRDKLAAKLGATPAGGGKFAMEVSNRGESGENVISARPAAPARRAAPAHAAPAAPGAADGDANANVAVHAAHAGPAHWSYSGPGGPEAWARLEPEYSKCGTGSRQSPIDIRGGIAVDLEPIRFDYRNSSFAVIDNGHTVQVNVEPGNGITIMGRRFELVQFHFHRPSEERVNGQQYEMVVHLVHKDAEGKLAVVAVLLDRGAAQSVVQTVWNNLPLEKGEELRAGTKIDLAQLLPSDRRYYTYMGSLTTPPCSEGVLWMVLKQPVQVSPEQLSIFSQLYPMNARPIQQGGGRLIKESN